MFEQMKRTAALFAVGALFSSGAWAADAKLTLDIENPKKIAAEFFGETREVVKSDTKLTLTITDASPGSTGNLTLQLQGAVFANTVSLSDFDLQGGGEVELVDGGSEGDSEVIVKVTTANDGKAEIVYTVPNLDVTPALLSSVPEVIRGVNVLLLVRPTNNKGAPLPSVDHQPDKDPAYVKKVIDTTTPALTVSTNSASPEQGGLALVNLNNQKVFAKGAAVEDSEALGLDVGGVSVIFNGKLADLSGELLGENSRGFGGDLDVKVTMLDSAFGPGDSLTFGGKKLEISSGGSAKGALAIADVGTSSSRVIYVPGGQEDLRPATVKAEFSLDFDDSKSADRSVDPGTMGEIQFAGIQKEAYAYGVIKANSINSSTLRTTCLGGGIQGCQVFADCNDEEGNRYFAELDTITTGHTKKFTSKQISEIFDDGGWDSGRGRCNLLSSGSLAVQHLINIGGHSMVNNSLVIGRGSYTIATSTPTKIDAIGIIR